MDIDDETFLEAVAATAEAEERRQQKRARKVQKRARKEAKRARKEAEAATEPQQQKQRQNGEDGTKEGEEEDGEADGEAGTAASAAALVEEATMAKEMGELGVAGTFMDDELWQLVEMDEEEEDERKRQKRERKERKRARKETKRARKEAEQAEEGTAEAEKQMRKRLKKKSKKRKKEIGEGSATPPPASVEETAKGAADASRAESKPISAVASATEVVPRRTTAPTAASRFVADVRRDGDFRGRDEESKRRSPPVRRPAAERIRRPYRPLPPRRVSPHNQPRVPVRKKRPLPSSSTSYQSTTQRRRVVRRSSLTPSPPPPAARPPRSGALRPLCARSLSPPTPPPPPRVQQQQQRERAVSASSAELSPVSRASSKSRGRSSSSASSSSSSSSSSARSRRSSADSGSRTYSSDSSDNEPKKKRNVRSYGPDASSWRMYEKARADFLQKKLTAGGQLPAHVRDPKLISTLRRPYIPGAGRRSTYGLVRTINGDTAAGTATTSTAMSISGLRGRGRIRGRGGRANFRFFPPRPKADYLDDRGQIDKRKLLEIATENATKLAMEGKLPKGAELVDTIKIKSVEQLATLCKQVAEEEATRPVPFTKWISPNFPLGIAGGASAKRAHRHAGGPTGDDDDYLLLQKVSSGSEEEGDEEERFQRRHESWKRRTQKAKEAGDDEAEGGDSATPFKKPLRLFGSEIKIKIAGSTQKSSWLQLDKVPPPPPIAPPIFSSEMPTTSAMALGTHSLSAPLLAAALVRPLPKPPVPPVFSSASSPLLPPPPTPPKLTPPPKPPLLIRSLPQPPKPPVLIPKQSQTSNKDSTADLSPAEDGQRELE